MTTNPQVLKVFEDLVSKLEKYMGVKRMPTSEYILNYGSLHNNCHFVEDYRSAYGSNSYLPPSIVNKKFGKNISKADWNAPVAKWFEENVLWEDPDTLGPPVFANYRDISRPIPNDAFSHGFWPSHITSFTTGPELVFPISTWTYESKVTYKEERLWVSAEIMGGLGADFILLSFVQDFFHASDIPDHVDIRPQVFRKIQDAARPPKHNLLRTGW
ncbi:MAG: hypothetical protein FRX48_04577 [Lasallia pustulata]|uniref:Uncharacterized protein n=1 Tax=Lasallia pustulata TaxID=136370 RepID=A0A5M8PQP8_9LECA|nr:MAG: hypothetical protein FRX48_04577 [Lasallia pustulata]